MPNNKLRDLLMKRTKWDGQQATQVSDALTEAIIAYRTLADIRDSGSMTYNLDMLWSLSRKIRFSACSA